jgi:hypothetical protein
MALGSSPIHAPFSRKTAHDTRKEQKQKSREPFCRLLAHDGVGRDERFPSARHIMKTPNKHPLLLPALIVGLGLVSSGRLTAQVLTTLHHFIGFVEQPYSDHQ